MKKQNNDKIINMLEQNKDNVLILPLSLESMENYQDIVISHISKEKCKDDKERDFLFFHFLNDFGKREIRVLLNKDIYALLWYHFASQEQKLYLAEQIKHKIMPIMTNAILQEYIKEKGNIIKVWYGKDSKTGYYTIMAKEPKTDILDQECEQIPIER